VEQVAWADRKTLGVVRKPFEPEHFIARIEQYAHLTQMKLSVQDMRESSGKWRIK
jgi:desulfoferrodoxin (superoxide reductase-like protein)